MAAKGSRAGLGCGVIWGGFLVLIMLVVGLVPTLNTLDDLGYQAGLRGGAVLRMTIDSCETRHQGKALHRDCYGHGDPGTSGVTTDEWMIHGASDSYPAGTLLRVRCTPTGGCTVTGLGTVAGDVAGLSIGLLFVSGALLGALVAVLTTWFPRRLERLPKRGLVWWFGGLGVLLVVSGLTAFVG